MPSLWDGLLAQDEPASASPSPLQMMMGATIPPDERSQSPLVGIVMGSDPRSRAAAERAGQAGSSMGSAAAQYLRDVLSGVYARKGLEDLTGAYQWNPSLSPIENARAAARDPASLEQATNIALALGFNPMKRIATPIHAYHGSPHNFDDFALEKIGTGEGAQAYGRGLYFAENPAVAKVYRDQVKDMAMIDANNKRMSEIAREMDKYKAPGGGYRQFSDPRGYALADEYDRLMEEKLRPGIMYEVNINANPEDFLQWDKPLREQGNAVRKALASAPFQSLIENNNAIVNAARERYGLPQTNNGPTGSVLYDLLRGRRGADLGTSNMNVPGSAAASDALREAGIPGIRYLDQGSRGAGRGTSNFVVFDPSIIEILRKYGLAGLLAGSGAAAMTNQSSAAVP